MGIQDRLVFVVRREKKKRLIERNKKRPHDKLVFNGPSGEEEE